MSTINRELACLKSMYNWFIRNQRHDFHPVKSVKLFNESHLQRDRVLSSREFNRLHEAANNSLKPLLTMAYYTAMRKGEILDLTWDKVDFKHKFIKTKTKRQRLIPLIRPVLDVLQTLRSEKKRPFVFHRNSEVVRSIKEGFKNACDAAKIKDLTFHDLRHMAIVRWVKAGLSQNAIMMISGHVTRSVFARYVNLKPRDVQRMLEVIEQ